MSPDRKEEDGSTKVEVDEIRTVEALEARTFSERFLPFNAEFTLFRKGIGLCIQLIHFLGDLPPKDSFDRTQRDLASDTIDSLWLAEHALLRGYENHALCLLRRAYETSALMGYFVNFPERVAEWDSGRKIRQSTIRAALGNATYPEPKATLDEMYRVYSLFTHVNRETIYHRLLGEPNRFTLGCQGNTDERTVGAVLRELLRQTSWFLDIACVSFLKCGLRPPTIFGQASLAYRDEVITMAKPLPALFPEEGRQMPGPDSERA